MDTNGRLACGMLLEVLYTVFVEVRIFAVYIPGHIILENVTCMFGYTCLYSFKDQPVPGSSESMMPVPTQRSSPLMFQHLHLSCTQQPTLEGLFSSGLTIPLHMEQHTIYYWILVYIILCNKEYSSATELL